MVLWQGLSTDPVIGQCAECQSTSGTRKRKCPEIFLNNAISLSPTVLSQNLSATTGFCFNHATATIATGASTANVLDTEQNVCKEICLLC